MSAPDSHSESEHRENRLRHETSPYLRQHMHHPVEWWPWGARPSLKRKPAIGRSCCPSATRPATGATSWRTRAFEDAQTAAQLNRDFVNIKVDREEHPDVDQLYQHALQILAATVAGRSPCSCCRRASRSTVVPIFLLARRTAGPRFGEFSTRSREAFVGDRARLIDQAEQIRAALHELESRGQEPRASPAQRCQRPGLSSGWVILTVSWVRRFWPRAPAWPAASIVAKGGFVGAPKFPNPTVLSLFLRSYGRTRERSDAEPAPLTLSKMAAGGIYDQLGGGFARYSTDAIWRVPHFEKMLYDNAQLLRLYAEAHHIHVAHGEAAEASAASRLSSRRTAGWSAKCVTRPAASSRRRTRIARVEGKFFLWTPSNQRRSCPRRRATFARCYGVRPGETCPIRTGISSRQQCLTRR